jgi:16S rRNA (guanine(966)-N(2))-methyltransferase RsmD
MRIIGGKAKGRIINFPSDSQERPTSDFLREALFNILGSVENNSFLDLYSGSGSVGLEAASRGARKVILIEKNKKIAAMAKQNIVTCNFLDNCQIMNADVKSGVYDLGKRGDKFDIVFADPPYNNGFIAESLGLLAEISLLSDEGVIVLQHSTREMF